MMFPWVTPTQREATQTLVLGTKSSSPCSGTKTATTRWTDHLSRLTHKLRYTWMIFTWVKKIIRNRVILQCDATWSSHIYDKMKDYVDGKADSMATGFGIETGVEIEGYVSITDADEVCLMISNLKFTWSNVILPCPREKRAPRLKQPYHHCFRELGPPTKTERKSRTFSPRNVAQVSALSHFHGRK